MPYPLRGAYFTYRAHRAWGMMKDTTHMPRPEGGMRNQKADDERSQAGDHFNNLYDQDEDIAGQKTNEATGKPIDNSPAVTGNDEMLREIQPDSESEDVLGKVPEEHDEAARWLREQGDSRST